MWIGDIGELASDHDVGLERRRVTARLTMVWASDVLHDALSPGICE